MKKLTIIGIAVLGLSLMIAVSPAGARPSMSKAEFRAVMLRGQALNRLYQAPGKPAAMSLAEYQALMARSQGLNRLYQAPGKPAAMSLAEYQALMVRSQALNQMYGHVQGVQVKGENYYARGFVASPDDSVPVKGENYFANGLPTSTPAVASSNTTDFAWGDVGIGVAGMLGLLVIAVGVIGLRRHSLHPHTS